MILRRINFYPEFHCLADECEDTCCAGWQIVVDDRSLKRYRKYRGPYKKQVRKNIDWKNRAFRQKENGDCAFLQEDGLCEMIIQMGEEELCRTCRRFPRHIEEFENVREVTLSMSCPEVARLLLQRQGKVYFEEREIEAEEEYDEFDPFLYSLLQDARNLILKMYTSREIRTEKRAQYVDELVKILQEKIDERELFSCGEILLDYEKKWDTIIFEEDSDELDSDEQEMMDVFPVDDVLFRKNRKRFEQLFKLEILRDSWRNLLLEADVILYGRGEDAYFLKKNRFEGWKTQQRFSYEIMKEQLLVYFTLTYFCGAVYDENLLGKLALIRNSVFWLEELFLAAWSRNEEQLSLEEMEEIVYRFCRELEHSDDNLKHTEKM